MILYYLMTFAEALLGTFGIRSLYEEPRYRIIEHLPQNVEIRDYDALVVVETDDDGTGSAAFQRLFNYITGANAGGGRIAMTVPVQQAGRGQLIPMTVPVETQRGGVMRFILPRRVAKAGPPAPTDPAVRLVTIPPRRIATLRFSGLPFGNRVDARRRRLIEVLAQAGRPVRATPYLLTYDAPFTIPFVRRNEVAVALDAPS